MRREFVMFALFFVVASILIHLTLLFSSFILPHNPSLLSADATDEASGLFTSCLGKPIRVDFDDCPRYINQSTSIEDNAVSCLIFSSQPNQTLIFEKKNYSHNDFFFNLTEEGFLSIEGFQRAAFYPEQPGYAPEYHVININAIDYDLLNECIFNKIVRFEVQIVDINDPPYFKNETLIPDIIFPEGGSSDLELKQFFDDPDVRPEWSIPLNFTYHLEGGGESRLIDRFSGSSVFFESELGVCPVVEYVIFEAIDPKGLVSDPSNVVKIELQCRTPGTDDRPTFADSIPPCISDYRCGDWETCLRNGTQRRVCEDVACGRDPKYFWRECEYIEDVFEEEELIVDPDATCFDGIRNCHVMPDGSILCEEGIDCGGPCEPCRRIETPGLIIEEAADQIILVLALIIVFTTGLVFAYLIYRKQILSLLAKIGWWITRKRRKQILLGNKDKEEILEEINELYSKILSSSSNEYVRKDKDVIRVMSVSRRYLYSALRVPETFDFVQIKKGLRKRVLNESLRRGMFLYSESLFLHERKTSILSKQELLNFVQETRLLVLNTSKLFKSDFNFKALELDEQGSALNRAQILIHNSFLALCFSEAISAKKNYYELLSRYDTMSEADKSKIYYELAKIYNYTKTILSWI